MAKQWIAILDRRGVLIGFDKNPPIEIPPNAVLVPEDCDLTPKKYRWTGTMFWPMEGSLKLLKEKLAREVPTCFYLLIKQLMDQKIIIPEKILKWMEDYKSLIEKEK